MKKIIKIVTIPCIILLLTIILTFIFSGGVKYEMVQHGEMEKSFSFSSIVIRDEVVIETQKKGVLESMVSDGEMVRKNKHVASVYESQINDNVKIALDNVNKRIEEIEKARDSLTSNTAGGFRMEGTMDAKVSEITKAMDEGDVNRVSTLHSELSLLNDKKNAMENGEEHTDEIIAALNKEKAKYEKELGGKGEDLFAPEAGIYSTSTDGFEDIITPDAIGEMTPYDYESICRMRDSGKKEERERGVCKIIKGTNWSVAFVATEKEIAGLKEGSGVYIRAKNHDGESNAYISYISTPVNGNYLVVATSDESCIWATKERFTEIDLVRNKYKGLRVPISALRVKDNETGVYTVVDGIVDFKKVNVLYKDTVYAIVEENNTKTGSLLLYDEVITSSRRRIKEGERVS